MWEHFLILSNQAANVIFLDSSDYETNHVFSLQTLLRGKGMIPICIKQYCICYFLIIKSIKDSLTLWPVIKCMPVKCKIFRFDILPFTSASQWMSNTCKTPILHWESYLFSSFNSLRNFSALDTSILFSSSLLSLDFFSSDFFYTQSSWNCGKIAFSFQSATPLVTIAFRKPYSQ